MERLVEQQGLPVRRTLCDVERYLDLCRRQGRSEQEGSRRGYLSRAMAGGSDRQADRTAALRADPGVQLHQISERGQGVYRLYAGEGEFRSLAFRRPRL